MNIIFKKRLFCRILLLVLIKKCQYRPFFSIDGSTMKFFIYQPECKGNWGTQNEKDVYRSVRKEYSFLWLDKNVKDGSEEKGWTDAQDRQQ